MKEKTKDFKPFIFIDSKGIFSLEDSSIILINQSKITQQKKRLEEAFIPVRSKWNQACENKEQICNQSGGKIKAQTIEEGLYRLARLGVAKVI